MLMLQLQQQKLRPRWWKMQENDWNERDRRSLTKSSADQNVERGTEEESILRNQKVEGLNSSVCWSLYSFVFPFLRMSLLKAQLN